MFSIILILWITSTVAIETDLQLLENLCFNRIKSQELAELVKSTSRWNSGDNCLHSVGFHFNRQLCGSFEPPIYASESRRTFTAYLSYDDTYLFVYLSLDLEPDDIKPRTGDTLDIPIGELHRKYGYFFDMWAKEKFLFVIWIKQKIVEMTAPSFEVSYSFDDSGIMTSKSVANVTLSRRTDTQILVKGVETEQKGVVSVRTDSIGREIEDSVTIGDSYLILCAIKTGNRYTATGCRPIEVNDRISCQCKETNVNILLVLIVVWIIFAVSAFFGAKDLRARPMKARTLYHVMYNCNERTFKYKYVIIVRLAKIDPEFDLTDVDIDVELFTYDSSEVITSIMTKQRFRAYSLNNNPITDIKFVLWRLTKLPEPKVVNISHTGSADGKICLLGVYTDCVLGEQGNKSLSYRLSKHITKNPRNFNLKPSKEQEVDEPYVVPIKSLSLRRVRLSPIQLTFTLFADIMFCSFVSTLVDCSFIPHLMFRILVSVLLTSVLAFVFNILVVISIKYITRKQILRKMKMNNTEENLWQTIYTLCYSVPILLMAVIISFYLWTVRLNEKTFVLFVWLTVTFCSATLVACSSIVLSYGFPDSETESELTELSDVQGISSDSVDDDEAVPIPPKRTVAVTPPKR